MSDEYTSDYLPTYDIPDQSIVNVDLGDLGGFGYLPDYSNNFDLGSIDLGGNNTFDLGNLDLGQSNITDYNFGNLVYCKLYT